MRKTSQTPNCCIRKTGHDIARIAFEVQTPLSSISPATGIFRRPAGGADTDWHPDGLLLNNQGDGPSVAILHVRCGDTVAICWKSDACKVEAASCFEVSATFEPVQINSTSPDQPGAVAESNHGTFSHDGAPIHMREDDLRKLLSACHPAWLQSRIDSALDAWRENEPSFFFSIAPSARMKQEIPGLVRWNPARALAEFKNNLGDELLHDCIASNPDATVLHAFELISRADRVGLVRSHSTYVLNHYLNRLTELELEVASSADAMTAFNLRHFVEGRRHAILLARSYPASFFITSSRKDCGLPDEVKRSVLDQPRIWYRIHHHSFTVLFRSLASTMDIVFSGEELVELLTRLGTRLSRELRRHISSLI